MPLIRRAVIVLLLIGWPLAGLAAAGQDQPLTPQEYRRAPEQTYLTYPEWFLVFSPAEYAEFIAAHPPSEFPFWGHIRQFWQGYGAVLAATRDDDLNIGYHVMVLVIGSSTTVEYAVKSAYETLIGRLSALSRTHGMTDEDRYAAAVAQDYVDFIRQTPWYEYDFWGKAAGLWTGTSLVGDDMIRKWERKYALTTEYLVKAGYGWLIKLGTRAAYEAPSLKTAIVVAGLADDPPALSQLQDIADFGGGRRLITVPRYDAFKDYALALAKAGADFIEIAGNRGPILVSLLKPAGRDMAFAGSTQLLVQPILTQPGIERDVLRIPVTQLAAFLRSLDLKAVRIEHIYDY